MLRLSIVLDLTPQNDLTVLAVPGSASIFTTEPLQSNIHVTFIRKGVLMAFISIKGFSNCYTIPLIKKNLIF